MNSFQRKNALRQFVRSFFALCFILGYLLSSSLFVFAIPENKAINSPAKGGQLLAQNPAPASGPKECQTLNLGLLEVYMASPQTKAMLFDPYTSVTLSSLSGKQSRFSDLKHSFRSHKIAWNLLGYPTSFGLTYNAAGKFVNVTTSSSPVNNLIGIASDSVKSGY